MMPIIDVFTCVYNEEDIISDYLQHYSFARHIFLYDNESTDRTVKIAKSNPSTIINTFSTNNKYDEFALTNIRNNAWRESDADYVVICDADEFIDCSPLESFGILNVAFQTICHNMIGIDQQPINEIRLYHLMENYNKISVFSPRIENINFGPGMHTSNPTCPIIKYPQLILRHYCYNNVKSTMKRFKNISGSDINGNFSTACRMPLSPNDSGFQYGFGWQYLLTEEEIYKRYESLLKLCINEE